MTDGLAAVIAAHEYDPLGGCVCTPLYLGDGSKRAWAEHVAAAIRDDQTVNSVEELHKLPFDTILLDKVGYIGGGPTPATSSSRPASYCGPTRR